MTLVEAYHIRRGRQAALCTQTAQRPLEHTIISSNSDTTRTEQYHRGGDRDIGTNQYSLGAEVSGTYRRSMVGEREDEV